MKNLDEALKHLKKDPVMATLVKNHKLELWKAEEGKLYEDLVETILGQQLSNKAAATIIKRFKDLFHSKNIPTPKELLDMPDEKIRTCGTSWSKIKYIKNVAQAFADKTLDEKKISQMTDDEVRIELIKIKGIGPWTIEMILMFTLKRPDIFSPGDVGLQNAMAKWYKVKRGDVKKMLKISQKWSPFRTTASLLLWKSID